MKPYPLIPGQQALLTCANNLYGAKHGSTKIFRYRILPESDDVLFPTADGLVVRRWPNENRGIAPADEWLPEDGDYGDLDLD